MRRPPYDSRLRGQKFIKDPLTKKIRFETPKNIIIPNSDTDIYLQVRPNTRLDKIAFDIYGDPTLWWIIATSNSMSHPWDFGEKSVLRIPRFRENVLSSL